MLVRLEAINKELEKVRDGIRWLDGSPKPLTEVDENALRRANEHKDALTRCVACHAFLDQGSESALAHCRLTFDQRIASVPGLIEEYLTSNPAEVCLFTDGGEHGLRYLYKARHGSLCIKHGLRHWYTRAFAAQNTEIREGDCILNGLLRPQVIGANLYWFWTAPVYMPSAEEVPLAQLRQAVRGFLFAHCDVQDGFLPWTKNPDKVANVFGLAKEGWWRE